MIGVDGIMGISYNTMIREYNWYVLSELMEIIFLPYRSEILMFNSSFHSIHPP